MQMLQWTNPPTTNTPMKVPIVHLPTWVFENVDGIPWHKIFTDGDNLREGKASWTVMFAGRVTRVLSKDMWRLVS